jgi:hypothetical protein
MYNQQYEMKQDWAYIVRVNSLPTKAYALSNENSPKSIKTLPISSQMLEMHKVSKGIHYKKKNSLYKLQYLYLQASRKTWKERVVHN